MRVGSKDTSVVIAGSLRFILQGKMYRVSKKFEHLFETQVSKYSIRNENFSILFGKKRLQELYWYGTNM